MTAPHPADRIRARVLLFMRLSGFVVLIAGLALWRTDLFGVRHELAGKIIAVEVCEGQQVTEGQKLLTLEAMKMEHTLTAPFDGTVVELNAAPGGQVQVEALLARIVEPEG